jgi:hypothetical protein
LKTVGKVLAMCQSLLFCSWSLWQLFFYFCGGKAKVPPYCCVETMRKAIVTLILWCLPPQVPCRTPGQDERDWSCNSTDGGQKVDTLSSMWGR